MIIKVGTYPLDLKSERIIFLMKEGLKINWLLKHLRNIIILSFKKIFLCFDLTYIYF